MMYAARMKGPPGNVLSTSLFATSPRAAHPRYTPTAPVYCRRRQGLRSVRTNRRRRPSPYASAAHLRWRSCLTIRRCPRNRLLKLRSGASTIIRAQIRSGVRARRSSIGCPSTTPYLTCQGLLLHFVRGWMCLGRGPALRTTVATAMCWMIQRWAKESRRAKVGGSVRLGQSVEGGAGCRHKKSCCRSMGGKNVSASLVIER